METRPPVAADPLWRTRASGTRTTAKPAARMRSDQSTPDTSQADDHKRYNTATEGTLICQTMGSHPPKHQGEILRLQEARGDSGVEEAKQPIPVAQRIDQDAWLGMQP